MSDKANIVETPDEDPRQFNGNKEGVKCLECQSVIFSTGKLLRHIHRRGHTWFCSGDDVTLKAKVLTQDGFEFQDK